LKEKVVRELLYGVMNTVLCQEHCLHSRLYRLLVSRLRPVTHTLGALPRKVAGIVEEGRRSLPVCIPRQSLGTSYKMKAFLDRKQRELIGTSLRREATREGYRRCYHGKGTQDGWSKICPLYGALD